MDDEQRFLLDLNGYLHLRGVLGPRELAACRAAADRHIDLCERVADGSAPADSIPEGFGNGAKPGEPGGKGYGSGYAWEKCLEQLTFHPRLWPIVLELTEGRPGLSTGTMIVDDAELGGAHVDGSVLHCAREDIPHEERPGATGPANVAPFDGACVCEERDGKIFCDNFVCFPYLDTVEPGDGGLVVLPGSHKSKFNRPTNLFGPLSRDADTRPDPIDWTGVPASAPAVGQSEGLGCHELAANITPQAGDMLIMPEATT